MKPAVDRITLLEYTEAIRQYYSNGMDKKNVRLGQHLCNSFNIKMSQADEDQIFYEPLDTKAMELFSNYIQFPS